MQLVCQHLECHSNQHFARCSRLIWVVHHAELAVPRAHAYIYAARERPRPTVGQIKSMPLELPDRQISIMRQLTIAIALAVFLLVSRDRAQVIESQVMELQQRFHKKGPSATAVSYRSCEDLEDERVQSAREACGGYAVQNQKTKESSSRRGTHAQINTQRNNKRQQKNAPERRAQSASS